MDGRWIVKVVHPGSQLPDARQWLAKAKRLSNVELAMKLNVSRNHARSIRLGLVTTEYIAGLAEGFPL